MNKGTRLSTGVPGLDNILHGGLAKGFLYLLEGSPGAGKTTLALQFLIEGAQKGEKGLYISLAESEAELRHVAESHNFDLHNVEICKISPPELETGTSQPYTVFQPAEVELADVVETILAKVQEIAPSRVAIDSMSELRMLARDSVRYRRQVLALKQFFEGRDCTTLLLDERFRNMQERQVQTIAHGVISLEVLPREYGITRRRMEVLKVRASSFREGFHDYIILTGGLRVFPRLVSGEHRGPDVLQEDLPSGIAELDALFNGGVQRGTSTLIVGPTGCGKSTLCTQWVVSAAKRGECSAVFTFDETKQSFLDRARALGMPVEPYGERGPPRAVGPGRALPRRIHRSHPPRRRAEELEHHRHRQPQRADERHERRTRAHRAASRASLLSKSARGGFLPGSRPEWPSPKRHVLSHGCQLFGGQRSSAPVF